MEIEDLKKQLIKSKKREQEDKELEEENGD